MLGQVLTLFEYALKTDQQGLFGSIFLKVMYVRTQVKSAANFESPVTVVTSAITITIATTITATNATSTAAGPTTIVAAALSHSSLADGQKW